MRELWSLISTKKRRCSAMETWQNGGFSYVFSFFMFKTNSAALRSANVDAHCRILLFPAPTSDITGNAEIDQAVNIDATSLHESSLLFDQCTISTTPYRRILFSWATSLVLGKMSLKYFAQYCRTMRDLQHAWFSAYIGDQWLNRIVGDLPKIDQLDTLIQVDSQINLIVREVSRFTSIPDSMSTSIMLRTQRVAAIQSGLTDLVLSIQSKLSFVRNEITSRIERRHLKSYRKIEVILFVLAFVQSVSAYRDITTGGTTFHELITIGTILLLLLLIVLWR
jgi:hypothetical protein